MQDPIRTTYSLEQKKTLKPILDFFLLLSKVLLQFGEFKITRHCFTLDLIQDFSSELISTTFLPVYFFSYFALFLKKSLKMTFFSKTKQHTKKVEGQKSYIFNSELKSDVKFKNEAVAC